jgi:hypothetical protein
MKNFSNQKAMKLGRPSLTRATITIHLRGVVLLGTTLVLAGFGVRAYNRSASLEAARSHGIERLTTEAPPPPTRVPAEVPIGQPNAAAISGSTGAIPSTAGPMRRAQSSQQIDKRGLHMVTFGLYDVGIEPDVIHTSKGLIAVQIEDVSGGSKGLLVERETGNDRVAIGQVLRFGPASQASWRGRSEFNLEPGTYRVTDTSRPQNFAHLIVEP